MREQLKIPEGWQTSWTLNVVAPPAALAGLVSHKAPLPQPRPCLLVEAGPCDTTAAMTAIEATIADLVRTLRGTVVDRSVTRFADGGSGKAVTIRFPVDPQRSAIQHNVFRVDGERLTTFVATVDATQSAQLDGLRSLIASYRA